MKNWIIKLLSSLRGGSLFKEMQFLTLRAGTKISEHSATLRKFVTQHWGAILAIPGAAVASAGLYRLLSPARAAAESKYNSDFSPENVAAIQRGDASSARSTLHDIISNTGFSAYSGRGDKLQAAGRLVDAWMDFVKTLQDAEMQAYVQRSLTHAMHLNAIMMESELGYSEDAMIRFILTDSQDKRTVVDADLALLAAVRATAFGIPLTPSV